MNSDHGGAARGTSTAVLSSTTQTTTHDGSDLSASLELSFDLVGLVVRRPTDTWPVMAGTLGGRFAGSGIESTYGWTHLRYANGFTLEAVYPEGDEPSVTIDRFLTKNGPGAHHLAFTVSSVDACIEVLEAHGVDYGSMGSTSADWTGIYIHPNDAFGVLVQLIERHRPPAGIVDPPEGFPEINYDHGVASLGRAVHAVQDLPAALQLYQKALGGRVVSTGAAVDGNHWVELAWNGPGRLRLLEATSGELSTWLGNRTGRIRHLFFSYDSPELLPGAYAVAAGRWAIDPDDTLGVRLVFSSSARCADS